MGLLQSTVQTVLQYAKGQNHCIHLEKRETSVSDPNSYRSAYLYYTIQYILLKYMVIAHYFVHSSTVTDSLILYVES